MASLRLVPVSHATLLSSPFVASSRDFEFFQPGSTTCRTGNLALIRITGALHARATRSSEAEQASRQSLGRELVVGGLAALLLASAPLAADATIQKVEGRERSEQEALTTGIREPSTLGSGKGNTVRESKINPQTSGGVILGAPKMEEPAGAFRAPQTTTKKTTEEGVTKKSGPAGILQGRAEADKSQFAGR